MNISARLMEDAAAEIERQSEELAALRIDLARTNAQADKLVDTVERLSDSYQAELAAKDREIERLTKRWRETELLYDDMKGQHARDDEAYCKLEGENAALRSQLAALSPVVLDTGKMGET